MPKASVVIPCYNQGDFIAEAIESVLNQTFKDFEVVIVNDGSTDPQTELILESYNSPPLKVINTDNQGVASARNNGIRESASTYILPLDADDKIGDSYLEKAVDVLDSNPDVGIVYCEAEFFGDKSGKWELPEYSFPEILLGNVIFCSGVFRKSDWQSVNGYNSNMKYGFADFDFWLSLIELGRNIFRIPETLFFYRQRPGSMSTSITPANLVASFAQLFENHHRLYADNVKIIFEHIVTLREQVNYLQARIRELEGELNRKRVV